MCWNEKIHRQALRLQETVLGKEHPSTLTSMNTLAGVLRDQGKYEEAEEYVVHEAESRCKDISMS